MDISEKKSVYDIIITGGGMAGATTAIALARLGLSIALIEAVEPKLDISPSFDQRAVALSASSVAIYQSLGLWPRLRQVACPIKHISVSDQGNFGFTRLTASDYNVDALGQVIPLDETGPILWQAIQAETNISVYCPEKVESVNMTHQDYCSVLTDQSKLRAKLLIAADGTYSQIAKLSGIDISREPYAQHAVIANIETEHAHQNRAYERFTAAGPLALLPLTETSSTNNRMSLVWCHADESVDQVMCYSDKKFIQELQENFGYRLGRIKKVGKRNEYPLSLHIAQKTYSNRLLLLGNSAHTLHPIAGQGFNLGLRDIADFVETVERALEHSDASNSEVLGSHDYGSRDFLEQYTQSRQKDWQQTIVATDSFARLFSNQFLPLVLARNKAMNIINRLPFVKSQLAHAAMGYGVRSSRLARGLPLRSSRLELSNKEKLSE